MQESGDQGLSRRNAFTAQQLPSVTLSPPRNVVKARAQAPNANKVCVSVVGGQGEVNMVLLAHLGLKAHTHYAKPSESHGKINFVLKIFKRLNTLRNVESM